MLSPFAAWNRMMSAGFAMAETGMRVAETMQASQGVVAARTGMMGRGAETTRADRHELARMVPEKVAAFSRSGTAVADAWWKMNLAFLAEAQHLGAMAMRGRMATPAELQALASRQSSYAMGLFEASARMGEAALKPVHKSATGNARRLARRK